MRDVPTQEPMRDYFGADNMQKIVQGAQTLSIPMKELRAPSIRRGRIVDNGNPIAEWCRSNVVIRTDVNGNIQPDKKEPRPAQPHRRLGGRVRRVHCDEEHCGRLPRDDRRVKS